jgi:transcriptional activator HAC1
MANTPHIKFESPAETLVDSFASTPGTHYSSLFPESMDMSPQSYDDESMFGDGSMAGTPAPEKKQVKKRKSWGQQLPEPKTNLPPRKRAKTEDEKEQRRVERVLRNRRAAQSSRERKRQEVEALENEKKAIEERNQDLEMRLAEMAAQNALLQQQLQQITGGKLRVFQGSSVTSSPCTERVRTPAPVTFSQDLFGSRDQEHRVSISTQSIPDSRTVNPASLSPEIRPVTESTNASSSDMTQHPAAMLCDLQCQSEEQRPWMNKVTTSMISQLLAITLLINMTSTAISTLLSPLSQIVTSLKTGSSLSSTPSILTLIIWLVTTTTPLTNSTSTISSTKTASSGPRFSLRIHLLRRLLACSPNLARPLTDATMVAMRSASEQQFFHSRISGNEGRQGENRSPSVESLMTLLWAIKMISEEERSRREVPQLDVATEIRQVCEELHGMFGRSKRTKRDTRSFDITNTGITGKTKKSLGDGRMVYP